MFWLLAIPGGLLLILFCLFVPYVFRYIVTALQIQFLELLINLVTTGMWIESKYRRVLYQWRCWRSYRRTCRAMSRASQEITRKYHKALKYAVYPTLEGSTSVADFTIGTETGRYHSVSIQSGSFQGPLVDLTLSAKDAYALLVALQAKQAEILDMISNYYDCKECGQTHRNGETCVAGQEDEEE